MTRWIQTLHRPLLPFALLLPLFLLGLAGCHGDPNDTILQYMPDMADSPTVKPQESYIDPPDGSVPMTAIIYPSTPEEAEKILILPPRIAQDKNTMAEGKILFETFCQVCHGAGLKGDNKLGDTFPKPPDLTHEAYKARGDGFFFFRITFGSAVMPSYGHAISPPERWKIVHYLRSLQSGH